ncbi:hypothetical protein N7495_008266 [Penicillium taxi]|uniref:uncharacterized protein n=1 Tax=Penicillium taxi TaxID=168475 RepID=UPI0025452DDE|nr:uncharacterized protein N7495_008266 [Penicillium taxi]KAJ5888225.1 hypothetical protein N7495_008266 [Penicillium taxi]
MDQVRKTYFDPLAISKAQIRGNLEKLPVGSAHPFNPEKLLLCRSSDGIVEIDISSYREDFFFNAVDLGEMGETLLHRMSKFKSNLGVFEDFQIMQAPASTFKIPIVSGQIMIFALSRCLPTYYDFCLADASYNTCCYSAMDTFRGIRHSGDIKSGEDLLQYSTIQSDNLVEKELCVFISGFHLTPITKFLGTNPALLVADHVEKVLYIIPVPLDAATVGDATICCPIVIKRDGESLICSVLPTATTDRELSCQANQLESPCFQEAINRADFKTFSRDPQAARAASTLSASQSATKDARNRSSESLPTKKNAVFITDSVSLPSVLDLESAQIIRFGTGIEFELLGEKLPAKNQPSALVLPCIFGQLEGPLLLATGTVPSNVPFTDDIALRDYYKQLQNIVVIVDDKMTDNARNIATAYRINALFIVQLSPQSEPKNADEVLSLLNSANVNAVTALAGPQSLVLVQIFDKYYFYRGLANRAHLNTSELAFGSDVTSLLTSTDIEAILDPRIERIVILGDSTSIILPASGQVIQVQDLQKLFEQLSFEQLQELKEDIYAAVSQLQVLLSRKDLQELSKVLVSALQAKIMHAKSPLTEAYIKFLTQEYNAEDPELQKKKNSMLGELRKRMKETQRAFEPLISSFSNMVSSQTTSKRTHDLQRLVRQSKIQSNVENAKSMTFETLAGYLETYAEDMGVLLLSIETSSFQQLLGDLQNKIIDASSYCDIDSRILNLNGFDAGIIIEQSQNRHHGLQRSDGSWRPTLAMASLNRELETNSSMIAWVCWDEFVNLKSPYTVRWMDKCNEPHISALRIIMRFTLSQALASREYNIQPESPETGRLLSALLMAAMSKLAERRTTAPLELEEAEDTVTRLMRGLFGNLLTIAGSGVRPTSMVWQLFGLHPQYDVPTTDAEWVWYKNVVALYPYTGWPLNQFNKNLEKIFDKVIFRVVTKNENLDEVKAIKEAKTIESYKLRDIELYHSRTILTVLMRTFSTDGINIAAVATRLLESIPSKEEIPHRSRYNSYSMILRYLDHLARGGPRRAYDDLIAARTYISRSAIFSTLKTSVAEACKRNAWTAVKKGCQQIMEKHAGIASLWNVDPKLLKMQNMQIYKNLLDADFGDDIDEDTMSKNVQLTRKVYGDAEIVRAPWQLRKKGELNDTIEPLDEIFLQTILTGKEPELPENLNTDEKVETEATSPGTVMIQTKTKDGFEIFKSTMNSAFIKKMQQSLSPEDVCSILNIPATTVRVFIKALNPEFVWGNLGENFKEVILGLLKNRSNRADPTAKLLDLGRKKIGSKAH